MPIYFNLTWYLILKNLLDKNFSDPHSLDLNVLSFKPWSRSLLPSNVIKKIYT